MSVIEKSIFDNDEDIEKLNEDKIIELAKNNNEKAIECLLNKYKNLIYKLSKRYYVMNYDKEDIINECILYFYKAIIDFKPEKISFKTFLYFYLKKRILTLLRNSNRQKRNFKDFIELKDFNLIYEDNKVKKIENKQILEKVKNKLSNLELKVLNLYLNSCSYNEIEKLLKINKKQIDNAIKRVKDKIKEVVSDV